jgi:Mg/Co/Ni transporter MgtE
MPVVKDLMSKEVTKVPLNAKISEVAFLLHANDLLGVPVVNESDVVCGVITERELFSGDHKVYYPTYIGLINKTDFVMGGNKELPYEAERITRITAEEIMNKRIFFAPEDMDLKQLAVRMLSEDAGLSPVVDSSNHLLGVVYKDDLLKFFADVNVPIKAKGKEQYVDKEFDYVQKDLSSRFVYVAKARANIWLTVATVLFIIGFLAGMAYVVNPNIFSFQNGKIQIQPNQP